MICSGLRPTSKSKIIYHPVIEREYLLGPRWKGELISPYLITAPGGQKAIVPDTLIALYAGKITTGAQVMPLMRLASQRQPFNILLVAYEFSEEATKTLVGLHTHPKGSGNIIGFKMLKAGETGGRDLADMASLCGAEVLGPDFGLSLENIKGSDLGQAHRIEANRDFLTVIGGNENPVAIARQQAQVKAYGAKLEIDNPDLKIVRERLGRLGGRAAVLKLGSLAKTEREMLHGKAVQGVKAVQSAVRAGVVPGGGSAYLRCIPAVEALYDRCEGDEQLGVAAFCRALSAPFDQIIRNGGDAVPEVVADNFARLNQEDGGNQVYDVVSGQFVDSVEAGLLDSAEVVQIALESASSGAMMALSIDCVVLNRKPELSYKP